MAYNEMYASQLFSDEPILHSGPGSAVLTTIAVPSFFLQLLGGEDCSFQEDLHSILAKIDRQDLQRMNDLWAQQSIDHFKIEDREMLIRLLQCFREQWILAREMVEERPGFLLQRGGRFASMAFYHMQSLALSMITILMDNLKTINKLEGDFFSAIRLHPGTGFRVPTATTWDLRNSNDQTKWKNKIKERYKTVDEPHQAAEPIISGSSKPASVSRASMQDADTLKAESARIPISKRNPNPHLPQLNIDGRRQPPGRGWCPILKEFIPNDKGCAAHIVSHAWGYEMAESLFGEEKKGRDIIWDVRNGLWMCKKVEEALDNGHIVLVPADNKNPDFQSRSYDIKLIVLDNTLFKKGRNVIFSQERSNGETKLYLWNDVDGKTLDFRGVEERPARKYLYFHYLHTVTRLAGQKARGWEYGLEQLGQVCESWATPGSYLTKGLINKFKGQASKTFRELKIGGVAGKLLSEEGKKEIDALLDSGFRSPD